jgi:hypothetical protein
MGTDPFPSPRQESETDAIGRELARAAADWRVGKDTGALRLALLRIVEALDKG